jgi:hypothetical protein
MVTRDDVIGYLLHRLPPDARAALTEQWLTDPELHEQLRMVEAELLDAYARDEASAEDRRAIEAHLLGSDVQRDKLAFAETLRVALPSPSHTPVHVTSRWLLWAAVVLMASLAGGVIWLARENAALRSQLATARPAPATVIADAGPIYAVSLRATDLRGGAVDEPRVTLPVGTTLVRFDLALDEADRAEAYTITLSQRGQLVWREEPVRRASNVAALVVPFWVPAARLPPGDYEIALAAGGRDLAFFRVHLLVP